MALRKICKLYPVRANYKSVYTSQGIGKYQRESKGHSNQLSGNSCLFLSFLISPAYWYEEDLKERGLKFQSRKHLPLFPLSDTPNVSRLNSSLHGKKVIFK